MLTQFPAFTATEKDTLTVELQRLKKYYAPSQEQRFAKTPITTNTLRAAAAFQNNYDTIPDCITLASFFQQSFAGHDHKHYDEMSAVEKENFAQNIVARYYGYMFGFDENIVLFATHKNMICQTTANFLRSQEYATFLESTKFPVVYAYIEKCEQEGMPIRKIIDNTKKLTSELSLLLKQHEEKVTNTVTAVRESIQRKAPQPG